MQLVPQTPDPSPVQHDRMGLAWDYPGVAAGVGHG